METTELLQKMQQLKGTTMTAKKPRFRCPICDREPEIGNTWYYTYTCPNCYCGAPDAGPQIIGYAPRPDAAADDWDDAVVCYVEMHRL